jgi:site-specific DNA-methyltransferase (adenine-specific)
MDADSGVLTSGVLAAGTVRSEKSQASYSGSMPRVSALQDFGGTSGGASRFFPSFKYQAKAHGGERDAGCEDLYWRLDKKNPFGFSRVTREEWETLTENNRGRGNVHPTLKSLALMGWLVSLLCPPGGRVGDLTSGSGSTGLAIERLNVARNLGASFLGSDICPEAVEIAEARLRWWKNVRLDVKPTRASVREDATEIQTSLFDRGRS